MEKYRKIAESAALEAGRIIRPLFGNSTIFHKGVSYNLVTQADTESESAIISILKRNFPDSLVLSEEFNGEQDLLADDLWIVDPLDGTNNFAHTIPHFSISIAHASRGIVDTGVIYDPVRDELFSAQKNSGAYLNERKIHVSDKEDIQESIIATGFYYDRTILMENTLTAMHSLFKANIQGIRRMGSAALDLCWVADGRFEGYFEYMLSPWDFAAGLLIVTEAGGSISDRNGIANGLQSKGIICSNTKIHRTLVETVSWEAVSMKNAFQNKKEKE